jgi:hypothetical protein
VLSWFFKILLRILIRVKIQEGKRVKSGMSVLSLLRDIVLTNVLLENK